MPMKVLKLIKHVFDDWPEEHKAEKVTAGETLADSLKDPWTYTNNASPFPIPYQVWAGPIPEGTEYHEVHLRLRHPKANHPILHDAYDFWDIGRLGHEVWHVKTGKGNEHHHKTWHCCLASYNPIRFYWHAEGVEKVMVRKFWIDEYMVLNA